MKMKMRVKIVFGLAFFVHALVYGQIPNWQNMDLQKDSVFGISTERAYTELLKGKKSKKVLVAVIDSGTDTTHEDLKNVLWINPKEKPDGKDNDGNGYADDLHGWSFIGGATGDVGFDNLEMTRIIRRDKNLYDGFTAASIPECDKKKYEIYLDMKKTFDKKLHEARGMVNGISGFRSVLDSIVKHIGKDHPTAADFSNYTAKNENEKRVKAVMINAMEKETNYDRFRETQLDKPYNYYKDQVDYQLNVHFDPRSIVADDYNNGEERNYGNNNVFGPEAEHGTHVSGIIAAERNNNIGINGIADKVSIMIIRTVPNGDERDKDVSNAIRYAADNGAKVINMSFGKEFSWNKSLVDEAVKYAMKKDVLIVHAAGNDAKDLDSTTNFPTRKFLDGDGEAENWIEVGASGLKDDSVLIASFSNYGKSSVDVFAPGVQIYSSIPGNKYEYFNGTSMAAPVVTGLAALIREYFPKLSAVKVKDIITRSVIKRNALKDKCIYGGVVNAYEAIKLAEESK